MLPVKRGEEGGLEGAVSSLLEARRLHYKATVTLNAISCDFFKYISSNESGYTSRMFSHKIARYRAMALKRTK